MKYSTSAISGWVLLCISGCTDFPVTDELDGTSEEPSEAIRLESDALSEFVRPSRSFSEINSAHDLSPVSDYGIFHSYVLLALADYQSSVEIRPIHDVPFGYIFNLVTEGPFPDYSGGIVKSVNWYDTPGLHAKHLSMLLNQPGDSPCPVSGVSHSQSVIAQVNGLAQTVFSVELTNCQLEEEGAIYSGRVLGNFYDKLTPNTHLKLAYDTLSFQDNLGEEYTITGIDEWFDPRACRSLAERTSWFTITSKSTLEQVMLSHANFYSYTGVNNIFCANDSPVAPNIFTGYIETSNHGRAVVETPRELFSFSELIEGDTISTRDYFRRNFSDDPDEIGSMVITSDEKDEARLTKFGHALEPSNPNDYAFLWLEIFEADERTSVRRARLNDIERGVWQSLLDVDQDGVEDAWEIAYGLNPNDPNDFYDDPDSDGYSNIWEFRNMGNPLDPEDAGFIADQGVEVVDYTATNLGSSHEVTFVIRAFQKRDDFQVVNDSVLVEIYPFDHGFFLESAIPEFCEYDALNPKLIFCKPEYENVDGDWIAEFQISFETNETVSVSLRIVVEDLFDSDPYDHNNGTPLSIDFTQ